MFRGGIMNKQVAERVVVINSRCKCGGKIAAVWFLVIGEIKEKDGY